MTSSPDSRKLRLGFAGTPEFAQVALRALLDQGFQVDVVLTQPDRPAGRGMKLKASPVKALALEHQLPVLQPVSLRKGEEAEQALLALKTAANGQPLDVLIVAAYGLILPQSVLDAPRLGCLNIHGSLLPRWRGAAPIHRAIQAGDTQTGVCIMQMDAGLDTGDVLLTRELPIADTDTTQTLHDKLADLGAQALIDALNAMTEQGLQPVPQTAEGVTYADKISKEEGLVNWHLPALQLHRNMRAFDPFPGCTTTAGAEVLKCFDPSAISPNTTMQMGTVVDIDAEGVSIQTGEGVLTIRTLQRPGAKRAPAVQVAQALGLKVGSVLGGPHEQ